MITDSFRIGGEKSVYAGARNACEVIELIPDTRPAKLLILRPALLAARRRIWLEQG